MNPTPIEETITVKPQKKRMTKQLATVQQQEPAAAVLHILERIADKGITHENVSALTEITNLFERVQAKEAEKQFNVAFVEFKKRLPQIAATKPVPNNDGTVRYRYAPLEEIEAVIAPIALDCGFTYSFSEGESQPGKITKVLTIHHVGGHSRSNSFSVRVSAPPKATDSQADGSTHSYAKRGAFCDGFGVIVDHDDDARMIGKPIGKALAEDLMARVKATKSDHVAFLKFAGVAVADPDDIRLSDYEQIPDERYEQLDEILRRKEGKLI